MIKNNVTVDEALVLLNGLLELDESAVLTLLANRVSCNKALADHPTVQTRSEKGGYNMGILGIINGLFGIDDKSGLGAIMFVRVNNKPQFIKSDPAFLNPTP